MLPLDGAALTVFVTVFFLPWYLPATVVNITAIYHCIFTLALLMQIVFTDEESEIFFGPLSVSKSRKTDDRPKRPFLEAKNS